MLGEPLPLRSRLKMNVSSTGWARGKSRNSLELVLGMLLDSYARMPAICIPALLRLILILL